ncbi:tyrosine-type recombinase/integrase [Mesorhizobium sp. M1217]|uniref:DUF6538 domain-containing protein n=1 Tax=Mesorhizobium sp. M1217 TaxID=2957070 RepID=UPI0033361CC7
MAIPKHLILIRDTYYANVRVPSEIAESYGKENVRRSLKTKDEREAGRRVHDKVATIEREFEQHRATIKAQEVELVKPAHVPATPQSFADLGRQYGREIAERELTIRADLYEAAIAKPKEFWRGASQKFSEPDQFTYIDNLMADGDLDRVVGYIIRKRSEDRIADLKRMVDTGDMGELLALGEERSPGLDRKAHVALALTLARAEIAALQNSLSGDLEGHRITPAQTPASAHIPASTSPALAPVSLDALFDKWKAETNPSASTLSTWRGIIKSLKAASPDKADDAGSITPEDMIKWKDGLVEAGLSPKTINASYLACVRTIFAYGVNNKIVTVNPGSGVKSAGSKKAGTIMLPYNNDEVGRLLELARKETSPAKRWLPWLAAQTGSRISEVAQLWGSFIKEENGIHYLDIKPAPDAGSIKEEVSERTVPLHPQLIEDGFLDFVRAKGEGPLFYGKSSGDPTKKHASKGVSNHLGTWIRENGFTDPRKAPNHALRHWFKTEASRVGIDSRDVDKLQGHAPRNEADKYYHPDLAMKLAALKKIKLPPVKAGGAKGDSDERPTD